MTDLSKKHVRIIDNGLFVSFARTIAKGFGTADYYCPYQSYAPTSKVLCVGDGFDEMKRIKFPLENADTVDLWVFLDLYHMDLQCYLEDCGARVWGPRRGEELEMYRWEFKEYLRKIGLPVQPCQQVVGMEALRELLKKATNRFIKTSFVRGDFETFYHSKYTNTEPRLDEIEHTLGPLKRSYEFVVEDEIPDAVEVGYDGFTVDGKFPDHSMLAYEVKDVGMIGTVKRHEEMPVPVQKVCSRLVPTFERYPYRGFVCLEIRYDRHKVPYLIDPCCRLGTPSNELLQELFGDWPQVIWDGADGLLRSPTVTNEFACAAVIHNEWAVKEWSAIHYPTTIDRFVKLRFHTKIDGVNYVAPQPVGNPYPGVVLGVGKTLLDAVRMCKKHASQLEGYGVSVSLDSLDKALDVIDEGTSFGIKFTDKPLPTRQQVADA